MHRGYIKIWRKLNKWEWYRDSYTLHLFIHLLLNANYKPCRFQGIEILRGQIVVGRKELSKDTGISEQSVRTSINKLKSTNEITIKSTNKFSIITLCNYELYQGDDIPINQEINQQTNQQLTSNQPTTNQQLTTIKELKNNKKEKNVKNNPYLHLIICFDKLSGFYSIGYSKDAETYNLDLRNCYPESAYTPEYISDRIPEDLYNDIVNDIKEYRSEDGLYKLNINIIENIKTKINFDLALISFYEHRKQLRKPLTEIGKSLLIKNLSSLTESKLEQIKILEQSIVNGWQGVFQLKEKQNGISGKNITRNVQSVVYTGSTDYPDSN